MNYAKKLQVFISSTFEDLKTERQAAVEAVLESGHIPAGMELFTAGNESQLQTICRWIGASDAYVLILGGRYGSIEPKTGRSYVELEYDYAVEKDIPFFAVVVKDRGIREYSTELIAFRKKVLSRTSSFFDDPKDVKLAIHRTLSEFMKRHTFSGWVRGSEIVDPTPLSDRINVLTDENKRLRDELHKARTRGQLSTPRDSAMDLSFEDIHRILTSVNITTGALTPTEQTFSLFQIMMTYRDQIIDGIRDIPHKLPWYELLYFTVCPRLTVYRLVTKGKLEINPNFSVDRYVMTETGLSFLAYVDRITYVSNAAK